MIIARRTLTVMTKTGGTKPVEVRFFAPEQEERAWRCQYEVAWPEDGWPAEITQSSAQGMDSVAALQNALMKVGAELHFSSYHREGKMYWGEEGVGYGFIVHRSARDLLRGDDAEYFG